jgi:hypothetical protein
MKRSTGPGGEKHGVAPLASTDSDGEALGLPWPYVNWDDETLLIRQAIQRQTAKGFVVEELKTPKSRRVVPLMNVAVDALRIQ